MTRSMPSYIHSPAIAIALAGAASCWSTASSAQSATKTAQPAPPPAGDTVRLTDEQREEILNNNTADSAAAARGELTSSERAARGIHGEVGVMVGTNGTRAAYGAAEIPLGDNARAAVSIESSSFRYRR